MDRELTISSKQGNGSTHGTSTTSTTNTVDVILRVVGVVIVEHVSDVLDVFNADNVSMSFTSSNVYVHGAIAILHRMRDLCLSVLREDCSIDDSVLCGSPVMWFDQGAATLGASTFYIPFGP